MTVKEVRDYLSNFNEDLEIEMLFVGVANKLEIQFKHELKK